MNKVLRFVFLLVALIGFKQTIVAQIQEPVKISKESDIDIKSYTGIISEQHANGRPSLWKEVVNGKAEGLWLEWFPNGNLRYRAHWKNNQGNGRWEYFYPNRQLRSVSFYIDDITQGIYNSYHENGQLKYDATYIDGKKDGVEFTYDENGFLLSRMRYDNGIQLIDEPVIFQKGNISAVNGNEWGISFMPDGNEAYFTRRDTDTGLKRIYRSTKTKNGWSKPSIASFSTDEDEGAFITNDGKKLFFASYKPMPDGSTNVEMDMNIWYVERVNDTWSEPKALSSNINKSMRKDNVWPADYEAGPMTDLDGNLYYWTKGAKSNATNLFYTPLLKNGSYGKPQELFPPSNNSYYDTSPLLSPDGKFLFFSSDDRADGLGGGDIYYSRKVGDAWSAPTNLGPVINSYQSEGSPSFSPDGKYFYFSSNRGNEKDVNGESIWNLYYIESSFLPIK